MQIKETKFRKQKNVMQVISKARNAVVKAKKKTLEMFSKKIKVDLSHAVRISLSVDLLEEHTSVEKLLSYFIHQTPSPTNMTKLIMVIPSKDEEHKKQ